MARGLETEDDFIQFAEACDVLEHYHLEHTDDRVTRIRGKLKGSDRCADIYIVSDPEWKKKLSDWVAPIMERSNGSTHTK